MTQLHVEHAAELWTIEGPTGDMVRVLAGEVRDAGGNVLFAGTADECAREAAGYRIPVACWPTKWERTAQEIGGADHVWRMAMAS